MKVHSIFQISHTWIHHIRHTKITNLYSYILRNSEHFFFAIFFIKYQKAETHIVSHNK